MYKWIAVACVVTIGMLAGAPAAVASDEFVYVESNIQTPNGNSILAFKRDSHGNMTGVAGSPFLTGGAGVQQTVLAFGPYDTDSEITIDSRRGLLFAVNSGSDTIAVFHINSSGSLTPVAGSPFPSGGTDPVSVAVARDFLFVVNQNGDAPRNSTILPNYTTFRIGPDGSLSPIDGSTVSVALGSAPSQALVVSGTNLLFGVDFLGGLMQSFKFDYEGRLHQRLPVPLPASEFGPAPRVALGIINHPREPFIYAGFPAASRLGVFRFDEQGHLRFVRSVPNSGIAICWLRTNRAGTRLYTSNQGTFTPTSTITVYDITDADDPVEIQSITLAGTSNSTQIELSADERNLFAVSQHFNLVTPLNAGKELHVLSIAPDGSLSESISPVPMSIPDGAQPQGLAVFAPR